MFARRVFVRSGGIRSKACVQRGAWVKQFSTAEWREQASIQPDRTFDGIAPFTTGNELHIKPVQPESVKLSSFSKQVSVEIDGETHKFDSIFLRDSCRCPVCVNPSSSQKNFQTADIPAGIEGSCQVTSELEDSELALINWSEDIPGFPEGHQTALPLDFLRESLSFENEYQPSLRNDVPERVFWDNEKMTRANTFLDYSSFMRSDRTLYQALKLLYTHGLVFIKNIPDPTLTDSSKGVTSVVERIGHLRGTFYGQTWDVKSVPNARNVAYTEVYLGFHMDLCYLDNTPYLQFLHSMRARAPGGESMFADSFYAAEKMRKEDPELFEAFRTFDVTYNYFNDGQAYRQVRPTIELVDPHDPSSPIKLINWSPPFQGPFAHNIGTKDGGKAFRAYHAATQKFDQITNNPANMFEYRMNEGDCVIFDNRRVLHARRAFDAQKGERWLKGAYLDRDVFTSKLAVLSDVYGSKSL